MTPSEAPTPLIDARDRAPIPVAEAHISRFRVWQVGAKLGRMVFRLMFFQFTGRLTHAKLGRELRAACERLGVLWIKIGQHLSMRADLLPPETCRELAGLTDRVAAFPSAVAVRTIERELSQPLFSVFSEFEKKPVAAASISQVHTATLRKEGLRVAVKVIRPDVEEIFRQDIRILRFLVDTCVRLSILLFVRWQDLLWEIEQVMEEEIDFRYEASNLQRMHGLLRRHGIRAPQLYARYSTSRVLIMEFIDGVTMSDYLHMAAKDPARLELWQRENRVQPEVVGKLLFTSYFRQVLEDNLFHCDLHPGNIMLLRDSRIALLDFGSLGSSERDFLRRYRFYLEASWTGQYAKAVDYFLLFSCYGLPATDLAALKSEMVRLMLTWGKRFSVLDLPYDERCFSSLGDGLLRCVAKYSIPMVWSTLRIVRGLATMDASLRVLARNVDLAQVVIRYFDDRNQRVASKVLGEAPGGVMTVYDALAFPVALEEQMNLRAGMVRSRIRVFERDWSRLPQLLRPVLWLLAAALVMGALAVAVASFFPVAFHLDFQVRVLIIIALLWAARSVSALRRRIV
jgi:ubiquinone biosynthesis protein